MPEASWDIVWKRKTLGLTLIHAAGEIGGCEGPTITLNVVFTIEALSLHMPVRVKVILSCSTGRLSLLTFAREAESWVS